MKEMLDSALPCSTTLVENSSLSVNWEQLEPDVGTSGLWVGPWLDLAPFSGSVPTTGRNPASSPRSIHIHTGSSSIFPIALSVLLNCLKMKNVQQMLNNLPEVVTEYFRSTAPKMSPYCKTQTQLDYFLSAFSLHGGSPRWRSVALPE